MKKGVPSEQGRTNQTKEKKKKLGKKRGNRPLNCEIKKEKEIVTPQNSARRSINEVTMKKEKVVERVAVEVNGE